MQCNFKPYEDGVRCVNCDKVKQRPTRRNCDASGGLGERVASFIKATTGIKSSSCGGCQGRREALNRMTARRRRKKEERDGT
jgi:hypothetical protein